VSLLLDIQFGASFFDKHLIDASTERSQQAYLHSAIRSVFAIACELHCAAVRLRLFRLEVGRCDHAAAVALIRHLTVPQSGCHWSSWVYMPSGLWVCYFLPLGGLPGAASGAGCF
jgi:hypothetical protein